MTRMLGVMGVALGVSACQGCREEHPYVPYSISGEAGLASPVLPDAQAVTAGEEDARAPFTRAEGVAAPANSAAWTFGGAKLEAPAGTFFVLGLLGDLNGDGANDVFAIVRGKSINDSGQLVFYAGRPAGGVEPGVVVGQAPPAPADPSCSPLQSLGRVGPHSVFVELGARCAGHGSARQPNPPSRWAAVASVGRTATIHFSLLVTDPPGAPLLRLDADGSDYDGDGIDDLAVRVTLEGAQAPFESGPPVSALIRWIDRPAGMSRVSDQPEASFHTLAALAAGRATKAKEAAAVPVLVHQVRALYAAICNEGGSPRLIRALDGGPIVCGTASRALEDVGLAEVKSLVTTGDVLGAIAALGRAQQTPAAHTVARSNELQAAIVQLAPLVSATSLRAIAAVPLIDHGRSPSWGAMMFEPSGKLLVRTLGPVVRVDPVQGDEAEASEVPSWKAAVASPDGTLRWNEVADPCDGSAPHATFTGDGDLHDVLIPMQGRFGARCGARTKGEVIDATPTAWGKSGLEAIIAGQPVAFALDLAHATVLASAPTQPTIAGAPRSPDGKTLVVPTAMGIVVRGARTRIYRAKELEGAYLELRDCTVSDDAVRVACVRGGRAFVGLWQ